MPNSTVEQRADLFYREGTSDKVYHATLEKFAENVYCVNFAYGRRGGALATGSKTANPVDQVTATTLFTELVNAKLAKGYRPMNGTAPAATSINANAGIGLVVTESTDTGMRPQLLCPILEADANDYIARSGWAMQEKYDGTRKMLKIISKDEVVVANKLGKTTGTGDEILKAAKKVGRNATCILDGEQVGETFHAFDILELNGQDLRDRSYAERFAALKGLLRLRFKHLRVALTAVGENKATFFQMLKRTGKEGCVFKDLAATYVPGRPNSGGAQVKCKFWFSASCFVLAHTEDAHSIRVGLTNGGSTIRDMGAVTIGQNTELPAVGAIVEIKYLYVVGLNGSFYQPSLLAVRDDVTREECTVSAQHIKYKGQAPEDQADNEGAE